jgi:hypothetical protein
LEELVGLFGAECSRSDGVKALGFVAGGILSITIAVLLIGLTSAMQIQKTLVFAGLLCLIVCPTFAWAFGKFRRKAN